MLKRSIVFLSVSCLRLLNTSSFVSFRLNFSLAVIRSPPPPSLHPSPLTWPLADISQQCTACCLFKKTVHSHMEFRFGVHYHLLLSQDWQQEHAVMCIPGHFQFLSSSKQKTTHHIIHIIKFNEWRTTTQTPNAFWLNWQILQLAIFFMPTSLILEQGWSGFCGDVGVGGGGDGVCVGGACFKENPSRDFQYSFMFTFHSLIFRTFVGRTNS